MRGAKDRVAAFAGVEVTSGASQAEKLEYEAHGANRAIRGQEFITACVRATFSKSVPQGRLNLAQDVSPGHIVKHD